MRSIMKINLRVRHHLWIFAFLFIGSFNHADCLAASESLRNVLVIHSYNERNVWAANIHSGLEDELKPDDNNLVLHVEYMDAKQFYTDEYFSRLEYFLKYKYRDTPLSLVMVSDNQAFDFIRRYRDDFVPGVPIVFCGVGDYRDEQLSDIHGITGVSESFSARETVETALRLHPETEEIYIINDYLKTGRAWVRDIQAQLKPFEGRVRLIYNENKTVEEVKAEIKALPSNAIVLLGAYFTDRTGRYFQYEKPGSLFAEVSPVPFYCLLDFNVRDGAMGGDVISGQCQGKMMAALGKRILSGENPDEIPVVKQGINQYMFDYGQLHRFGISEQLLPKGSLILGRPSSMYREHKGTIWTFVLFIVCLVVIIIVLYINMILRKRAEESLRESKENLRITMDAIGDAVLATDAQGLVIRMNPMAVSMTGWSVEDAHGRPMSEILELINDETRRPCENPIAMVLESGRKAVLNQGSILIARDGRERRITDSCAPILNDRGELIGAVLVFHDTSEQYILEEQLRQSQKMESIGQLAGGVAHDFNNMLGGILGAADLLDLSIPDDKELKEYIHIISDAASRAADLTHNLLTFSRKTPMRIAPLDFHVLVRDSIRLLGSSIDKRIAMKLDLEAESSCINGDASQLQNVILNLGLNARDAMPKGGVLTIGTRDIYLHDQMIQAHQLSLAPGHYLEVLFRDNGVGMDAKTQKHIFEPFFTTKKVGSGTGLGLAAVYGAVMQHKGNIKIQSEPGLGTQVTILLPLAKDVELIQKPKEMEAAPGRGCILVIDDEKIILAMAQALLKDLGYDVLQANDGPEGLKRYKENRDQIDLVLLDMVMPKMNGEDVFWALKEIDPSVKVVLSSGYCRDQSIGDLLNAGVLNFLQKPYRRADLAQVISEALH